MFLRITKITVFALLAGNIMYLSSCKSKDATTGKNVRLMRSLILY